MLTAPGPARSEMFWRVDPTDESLRKRVSTADCPTWRPGGGGVQSIWTPQSVGQAEGPVVDGACPGPKPAFTTAERLGIAVGAFCAVALPVLFALLL